MAEKEPKQGRKEGKAERASRFLRNINVLGALALGGAAVIAPPVASAPLTALAGLDVLQAGGFEAARRHYAKKRQRTEESGKNS